MAFRLADLVIAGAIYHSRPFSVHGRILLRGCETPVMIELTGAPSEDLRGRSFEFEVAGNDRPATDEDRAQVARFHSQQIGPTGEMTAVRRVKTFDCSAEEFFLRSRLDEPPPIRWQRCLYLEWFSQNGRVLIELPNPQLRFLDGQDAPAVVAASEPPEADDPENVAAPECGVLHVDDEIDPLAAFPSTEAETADAEDAGYGLIPEELNRELERAARRTDRAIAGESEEASRAIEECARLDKLIERGAATPLWELFAGLRLPAPDAELTDEQAARALKTALAQLALFGIAYHVCEHCSLRAAYRIFVEKIYGECTTFPEMRGTSCVQHFSTSDFCAECHGEA